MSLAILILFAYLLGSIPTGFILTMKILNIDIRKHGSGNVGATNAARKLGFKMGALVALADILKGFFPVLIAGFVLSNNYPASAIYLVGIAAILGHDNSIFLKFDGGKGVATTFGVMLGISPPGFLIMALIWLGISFTLKIVSVASLIGAFSLPVTAYILSGDYYQVLFAAVIFLSIVVTHRGNIQRLLRGEENPINLNDS